MEQPYQKLMESDGIEFFEHEKDAKLFSIAGFKFLCKMGLLTDSNGFLNGYGVLATKDKSTRIVIKPSQYKCMTPFWATHVMWFKD